MIYELCCVQNGDASESEVAKIAELLRSSLSDFNGEIVLEDNWGVKKFAQLTSAGKERGNYSYFIFKGDGDSIKEITRRLRITESVLKFGIFKVEEQSSTEEVLKKYRTPFSSKHNGSVLDEMEEDGVDLKGRKRFARSKSCWFTAKQIKANWKDPQTFSWLVNEFGKISPARISGVSRKHQRFVTTAIKRARNLGVISHLSNRITE